jgi:uncharacterized membrane protein
MFAFMMMLAIASAIVELTFASKFPAWRRAAKKNKAVNLAIAFSFVLGIMFGAAGLIAMAAAIISTVIAVPGYAVLEWAYDSPEAQAKGGNLIKYYSDKTKTVTKDTLHLIYKILRIITFPIWASRSILEKLQLYMNKYRAFKARHISRNQA